MIPDHDLLLPCPGITGRRQGQAATVRAEGEAHDREALAAEIPDGLAGSKVPDEKLASPKGVDRWARPGTAAGGQVAPVRAEGEGVHHALVPAEVELLGVREAVEVEPLPTSARPEARVGASLQVMPRLGDVQGTELHVGLVNQADVECLLRLLPLLLGALLLLLGVLLRLHGALPRVLGA